MLQRVLFFLICSLPVLGYAQNGTTQLDLHLSLAVPYELTANADSSSSSLVGFGIGGGVTLPVSDYLPLRLGISFRYMWLGNEKRDFDFIDDEGFNYALESKVRGTMSPLHLNARIDPMDYAQFPVMPYAGGFAGARIFSTNHKITIDYEDDTEPIVENNRQFSITSSYGFELGLHIRVSQEAMIDLRYERAYGGWAKYVDLSSVEIDDNGDATYERLETRTDVEMFTLGIAFTL